MSDLSMEKRNYLGFLWHAIFLSITITFTEVNTVIPAMILQIGGGEIQVGIASAIMIGVPLIAQLNFSGFLHGRPRKKPYILLGINLRVLSLFLIALTMFSIPRLSVVQGLLIVYTGLLLFTLSGAFAGVSYVDLVGKSFSAELRRHFFTRKQSISSVGILVSALVTRQVLTATEYPVSYVILFLSAGVVLLIASLGFWHIYESPGQGTLTRRGYFLTLASMPGVLRQDPNLRRYLLYLNSVGIHAALIPFYLSLAKFRYTLNPALAGNLMMFQIVGMIVSSLIWPRIVRRGGFRAMLRIWSGLSCVLPLAALGIVRFLPLPFYLVFFFFVGAAVSARTVSRDAVTVELSTEENRVLYAGIIGTLNLSIVLVPILLGSMIALFGYAGVFVAVACSAILSFYFLRRLHCPVDTEDE